MGLTYTGRLSCGTVGLDWEQYVEVDPAYYRPTEVDFLQADASRARAMLGWAPEVSFDELVEDMVVSDLREVGLSLTEAKKRVDAGLDS